MSELVFYKSERTALFVDGANLYAAVKALDFNLDYKRVREYFASRCHLVRAFYYTALITEDEVYMPIKPLVDWLDYNGWTMVTKAAKRFTDSHGRVKVKGNMDIELAIDMLEVCQHVDHVVLFSGDGDFRRLVEVVQRKGVRVTVVSTVVSKPPMVADELRRQSDKFLDLADLKDELCRLDDYRSDAQEPVLPGEPESGTGTPAKVE